MRVAILVFPGSNCDRDMMVAVETITGRRPALVWHKDSQMDPVDLIILPGGFSFGDYLRCGALAARAPVVEAMLDTEFWLCLHIWDCQVACSSAVFLRCS